MQIGAFTLNEMPSGQRSAQCVCGPGGGVAQTLGRARQKIGARPQVQAGQSLRCNQSA